MLFAHLARYTVWLRRRNLWDYAWVWRRFCNGTCFTCIRRVSTFPTRKRYRISFRTPYEDNKMNSSKSVQNKRSSNIWNTLIGWPDIIPSEEQNRKKQINDSFISNEHVLSGDNYTTLNKYVTLALNIYLGEINDSSSFIFEFKTFFLSHSLMSLQMTQQLNTFSFCFTFIAFYFYSCYSLPKRILLYFAMK